MNREQMSLHKMALMTSANYRRAEAALVQVLAEVDVAKVYLADGKRSLFQYAVETLQLSEAVAYAFIHVARIPELRPAVADGLSVFKAHRLAGIINEENAPELIEFAKVHTSREIEFEVARRNPRHRQPMRVTPRSEEVVELRLSVSREVYEQLQRVAALEGTNVEDALPAMAQVYLYHKDPVVKAERSKKKAVHVHSEPVKHEVFRRTQGRCTYVENGKRCNSDRHVEIHHIKPRCEGGGDEIENLTVLCSYHHRWIHQTLSAPWVPYRATKKRAEPDSRSH